MGQSDGGPGGGRWDDESGKERERRRRMRSLAIGAVLGALAVIFYVATLIHRGGSVSNRPHSGEKVQDVAPPAPHQ